MSSRDRVRAAVRTTYLREERARERLGLSAAATALLGRAMAAVVAASVVLAAVGEDVLRSDGLEVRDPSNLQLFVDHRTGWLITMAKVASQVGSVALLAALAVAVGVLLWIRGARLAVAAAPLLSLLSAGVVVSVLKVAVGRDRPPLALRLVTETEKSFPSGHATDSAALFVALGIAVAAVVFRRPLVRAVAVLAGFLVAGLIGLSRLVLGVHWPTDVLFGWALGTAVAVTVTTTMLLLTRLVPSTPAGAGRVVLLRAKVLRVMSTHRGGHEVAVA